MEKHTLHAVQMAGVDRTGVVSGDKVTAPRPIFPCQARGVRRNKKTDKGRDSKGKGKRREGRRARRGDRE